jgi:hypothetical protein
MELSDITFTTDSISNNQQGGNLLDFFRDSLKSFNVVDCYADVLMKETHNKNFKLVKDLIFLKRVKKYNMQDNNGDTILHHLVRNFNHTDVNIQLIKELLDQLQQNDCKELLNIQNNNGDTVAHIACKLQQPSHELIKLFEEKGANLKLSNKEGEIISTDTISNTQSAHNTNQNAPNIVNPLTGGGIGKSVKGYYGSYNLSSNTYDTLSMGQINSDDGITETEFINKLQNKIGGSYVNTMNTDAIHDYLNGQHDYNDKYINNINNKLNEDTESFLSNYMQGGGNGNEDENGVNAGDENLNTETFIKNMVDKYLNNNNSQAHTQTHTGGYANTSVKGSRKLNIYSDYNNENNNANNANVNDMEGGAKKKSKKVTSRKPNRNFESDLNRLVKNQAGEIMKEAVKTIMDKLNVDEETAKNYKAVLWAMVKEKFPNEPNLNQAIELQKMAQKKTVLNKIDPKEGEKLRQESRTRSEERRSQKQQSMSSDSISATSSAEIESGANFSATSFSNSVSNSISNNVSNSVSSNNSPFLSSITTPSSISMSSNTFSF